jgi:hypothetical protein
VPYESSSLVGELLGTAGRVSLSRAGDLTLASQTLALGAGKRTLKLKPSRKLLAGARKKFSVRLQITAADAAGNRTTVSRRITVKP